ncbi:hypothetical protein [Kaarinaea lacus]
MNIAGDTLLRIMLLLLVIMPALSTAKLRPCNQASLEYLDEKVVFCLTRDSLSAYMEYVDLLDLDGLNKLVLTEMCNFIPDGEYLLLQQYRSLMINSIPVIAVDMEDITLWTFSALVSKGDPRALQDALGSTNTMALVKNNTGSDQCR